MIMIFKGVVLYVIFMSKSILHHYYSLTMNFRYVYRYIKLDIRMKFQDKNILCILKSIITSVGFFDLLRKINN